MVLYSSLMEGHQSVKSNCMSFRQRVAAICFVVFVAGCCTTFYPMLGVGHLFKNNDLAQETLPRLKSPHAISQQQYELKNCGSNNKLAPAWCRDADGTPWFIGDTECDRNGTIHKMYYNQKGFEQCLAKKTVFFIGDSRVWYQFMALAHFLKAGKWMKCADYIGLGINENQTLIPAAFL